jgi:hypothetical protein
MALTTHNETRLTQQGRPTDQAVKDEAFALWVRLGRSWRLVSQRLDIPEATLYRWRDSDNWEERRALAADAIMPGALEEAAFASRLAFQNATTRLQQIAADALDGIKPDKDEVMSLKAISDATRDHQAPARQRQRSSGTRSLDDVMQRERDLSPRST